MYTLEIEEESKCVKAILKDGEMFLRLYTGAVINEKNARIICEELNADRR